MSNFEKVGMKPGAFNACRAGLFGFRWAAASGVQSKTNREGGDIN